MKLEEFPKVTVILRGYTYSQIRTVVKCLVGTGLRSVEITMNTPDAVECIRKVAEEFGDRILVGAGTVTAYEEAEAVIKAGARFVLSPIMLSKEILDLCKKNCVISVPASLTPTEIKESLKNGADIVKVFPAGVMGAGYIKDIQAPLGKLPLMVVGGVNGENVQTFFDAGASFAGIGSGIFCKEDILEENEESLRSSIKEFEKRCNL